MCLNSLEFFVDGPLENCSIALDMILLVEMSYHDLIYPTGIELFKVNNRNTRAMHGVCSKLTKKNPERHN